MIDIKFLDLFAGIGGFRLGMERAGHECVGYVEWDKFARKSYQAIHDTKGEWTANDIRSVTDDDLRLLAGRGIELICGGFPCQAFSVAGKRGGFDDTRGTMFFEIARFAKQIKPRLLLLENVKGLLSHDKGNTFGTILHTLDELGYDTEWQVLNSKDFGVPQNRERVFIVGHLRGTSGPEIFPFRGENETPISIAGYLSEGYKDVNYVLNPNGIAKCLLTMGGGNREPKVLVNEPKILDDQGRTTKEHKLKELAPTLRAQSHGNEPKVVVMGNVNPSGNGMNGQVYDSSGLAPTLTTNKGEGNKIVVPVLTPDRIEKRQNGRRFKEDGEEMFTLTAQDRHGVAILKPSRTEYGKEIRKAYENGEVKESRHNMTELVPRQDGMSNTITTVQKDNLLVEGLPIKEATKKGCDIAYPGDSVNYSVPTSKTRRGRVGEGIANTLDTGCQQGVVTEDIRIRKLTPKECWRLQGFPDWAFERAAEVNSDSQLYKQAGNSVTVNVIYEIAKRLS